MKIFEMNSEVRIKRGEMGRIFVYFSFKGSKERKDRYRLLSEMALKTLNEYWKRYGPEGWLFKEGSYLSARISNKIFRNAFKKVGIKKEISFNTLRHGFAPYLLESGADYGYIQELLRHAHSKTIEIYTLVSTKNFGRIISHYKFKVFLAKRCEILSRRF